MKKISALVFALTVIIGLFAGCGENGGNTSGTDGSQTSSTVITDDIFSTEDVAYLDSNSEAVYRVVRPDGDPEVTALASKVFNQYKNTLGVKIMNVLDSEDGTDAYEILVGATNRSESKLALDYLFDKDMGRYDDYIICTIGKKLVINAVTNSGLAAAVEYFNANYLKSEGVKGGIVYTGATDGDFKDIPINGVNIGKFKMIIDATSRSYLVQVEAEKISELIKNTTGFLVDLENDLDTAEAEYEIIIGNATGREGVPQISNHDEYEVKISGKKVYLVGGSTYAVQVAVTEFCNMLSTGSVTDADSAAGTYTATVAGYDSSSYYKYVWGDEFNTGVLDTSKWNTVHGQKYWDDTGRTFVVDETTLYFTEDTLIMSIYRDDKGELYQPFGIKTAGKFRFNMGYLELRAKIPTYVGVYSSFCGGGRTADYSSDSVEIDVFENLGVANMLQANVHHWNNDGSHTALDGVVSDRKIRADESFDLRFHTVGLFWNENEMSFYSDGVCYYTQGVDELEKSIFADFQMCVNAGWEGRTPPGEDVKWPINYEIDYIRLFQVDGQSYLFN